MGRVVNIHEAKTHLSRLLEDVQKGEVVTIAKAGQPIAQLTPLPRVDIVFGRFADQIEFDDSLFLDPDAEVLAMFDEDLGLDR